MYVAIYGQNIALAEQSVICTILFWDSIKTQYIHKPIWINTNPVLGTIILGGYQNTRISS